MLIAVCAGQGVQLCVWGRQGRSALARHPAGCCGVCASQLLPRHPPGAPAEQVGVQIWAHADARMVLLVQWHSAQDGVAVLSGLPAWCNCNG